MIFAAAAGGVLLFVLGVVSGVYGATQRLRDQARALDAERAELVDDRAELRRSQREHYDDLVQFVAMKVERNKESSPPMSRWMA